MVTDLITKVTLVQTFINNINFTIMRFWDAETSLTYKSELK